MHSLLHPTCQCDSCPGRHSDARRRIPVFRNELNRHGDDVKCVASDQPSPCWLEALHLASLVVVMPLLCVVVTVGGLVCQALLSFSHNLRLQYLRIPVFRNELNRHNVKQCEMRCSPAVPMLA